MAKEYFEKLTQLIYELDIESVPANPIEVKHFFSGPAHYVDGVICVSLSPVGLAFKLYEKDVDGLISDDQAIPLQYFPNGPVKKAVRCLNHQI